MVDEATQRLTILLQARDRDFQRAMDRNNKLMAQVSKQMQGNLDGVAKAFTGSSKSAADSAKVFSASFSDAGESVERLRDAMNPLRKAARDLQADETRLNRALREGVIDAREHGRMMDFLRGRYQAAEDAAEALTQAQARTTGNGAATGQLQNASYQFQDIIVQISSGTAASVALSQQLPQLLSGFGAVGAGAGLAAALMIPLGAALLNMATNSETLDEKLETLAVSTDLMTEAAEAQATPLSVLREQYGDLADEVARANSAMAVMTAIRAKSDALGAANSLGARFADLNPTFSK